MDFFEYTTSKLVKKLHYAELDKRQRKTLQRLDDHSDFFSKKISGKFKKVQKIKNPKFIPQISEKNEPPSSILIEKVI